MKSLLVLLIALATLAATANDKVGLVLSGGGAKGLYHVGIIKALEENEIPIDYISGASMGAIVGALYAAGWSPERMWNFFLTDSVSQWITGQIPDQYKYYFRQFDPTPEMIGLKVNAKSDKKEKTIELPSNLIPPYLIDLAMNQLLIPASAAAGDNFDQLMVPFRCVASNMDQRELVVFKNGSLPYAVRTSMTIPLVFKPLTYHDSTLLFDGGLLNNYPYQTLQEDFNPAIIIGGVCTTNSKIKGTEDLIGQVMSIITQKTDYTLPRPNDVSIMRVMPKIGMLEYEKAEEIMLLGYQDAMAQMDSIKAKIQRRVSKTQIDQKRTQFLAKTKPIVFEKIYIQGLSPTQTAYIQRNLGLHLHSHVTFDYFYERYLKLIGSGNFKGEYPDIRYNPQTGFYRMTIPMSVQPSFRFVLGGNLSTHSLNQIYLGAEYQRINNWVSTYAAQGFLGYYSNAFKIGARHDVFTNFPFYFDYGYTHRNTQWATSNANNYYKNKDWRLKQENTNALQASIAIPVLDNSAFRGQIEGKISTFSYFEELYTSQDQASKSKFEKIGLTLELETNSMNYSMFPVQGINQFLSVGYHYGTEKFTPGTVAYTNQPSHEVHGWLKSRYMREEYFKLSNWFTLGYLVDVTFSTQPTWNNWLSSSISTPRFAPTPHMKTLFMTEYSAQSYLGFGVTPVFHILPKGNLYLKSYAYAFMPGSLIYDHNHWVEPTFEKIKQQVNYIFGGSMVYQTRVGPISFTVVKYTTGPKNWNFLLDFGYTLF